MGIAGTDSAVRDTEVVIVPYKDGPYLVRGPVELRDQDGRRIELGRRTIALCRCGKSRMRPFCDGTHRLARFRAPSEPETSPSGARKPPQSGNGAASHPTRVELELREAHGRLTRLVTSTSEAAPESVAVRSAEHLLAAASRLLGRRARRDASADRSRDSSARAAACLGLVGGAVEVLSPVSETRGGDLRELIAQLARVTVLLESELRRR
jgi:CDGSH-type Zn-finger protein